MKLEGVDLRKLQPGTKLEVHTRNSVYLLELKDSKGNCLIQGGKHVPEPSEGRFAGSIIYGGGPIRQGWITPRWGMELVVNKTVLSTTGVRKVKVIGDGWDYAMEWESL